MDLEYQSDKGPREDIRKRSLSKFIPNPALLPLSIFNMIASTEVEKPNRKKKRYYLDHVEMTPFDITCCPDAKDRRKYPAWRIKTKDFGVHHVNDEKHEGHPVPLSLSSTIAVAGSAITVDAKTIADKAPLIGIAVKVAVKAIEYFEGKGVSSEKPVTGIIHGFYANRAVPGRGGKRMVLRDAGFDYNLPMYPLMRPDRNCGVIIVLDASGDLDKEPGDELYKAIQDAKSLGRTCNELQNLNKWNFRAKVETLIKKSQFPIVFGNPDDPEELCVVYVPCVKECVKSFNDDKLEGYSPAISTTKLDYDFEEASDLHEFGRQLGNSVSAAIKGVIVRRILAMNSKLELVPRFAARFDPSKPALVDASYIISMAKAEYISKEALQEFIDSIPSEKVESVISELSGTIEASQNENLKFIIASYLKSGCKKSDKAVGNILKNEYKFLIENIINGNASVSDLIRVLEALSNPRKVPTVEEIDAKKMVVDIIDEMISGSKDVSDQVKSIFSAFKNGDIKTCNELIEKTGAVDEIAGTFLKIKSSDMNKKIILLLALVVSALDHQITEFSIKFYSYLIEQPEHTDLKKKLRRLISGILDKYEKKLIEACETGDLNNVKKYLSVILSYGDIPDRLILTAAVSPNVNVLEHVANNLNREQIKYIDVDGWNAVHHAIARNRVDNLELLHQRFPDMAKERTGRGVRNGLDTAAIIAIRYNAYKTLKFICDNKIKLNKRDQNNFSPLCWAYSNNDLKAFEMLLKAGANPTIKYGKSNNTLLHEACKDKRFEFVKSLLQNESVSNQLNERNQENYSPLCLAYYQSYQSVASSMVSSVLSLIPLTMVSANNNDDLMVFKTLLNAGAEPNIKYGTSNNTLLYEACKDQRFKFVEALLQKGVDIKQLEPERDTNNYSPLCWAYYNNDLKVFEALLKAGANPNIEYGGSKSKNSLLHQACQDKRLEFVQALLQADVDIKQSEPERHKSNYSPLCWAYYNGDLKVFEALLAAGANPSIEYGSSKNSLLHQACQDKRLEFVQALLTEGVDIQQKNNEDKTVLTLAYESNNIDMFILFLMYSADPNTMYDTKTKDTLLHKACKDDKLDFVRVLLETKGIEANTKNGDDKTPMEISSKNATAQSGLSRFNIWSARYPNASEIEKLLKTYDEEKLQSQKDFGSK